MTLFLYNSYIFGVLLGGSTTRLDAGINARVTSSKAYTRNVSKNPHVYFGYRALYNVEKGVKCTTFLISTTCLDTPKSYTVKISKYGEYGS